MTREGSLFDVPPAAIGRFRVVHQVGAGACGPVFRAVDPETDQTVALKLLALNLTPDRTTRIVEAFETLAAAAPIGGATRILSAGRFESRPFLVTTFVDGDSLDVALKQSGPAPVAEVASRTSVLAEAIDTAAANGVHHGALHPRDILLSASETALTGMGVWPVLTREGERLPMRRPYRAPELGLSEVSAKGDQFALAALAYEWVTGRRAPSAFVAADMAPVAGADAVAIAQVFAVALHADPDRRHDSCVTFATALGATVREGAAPKPAPRPRRRARSSSVPALPLEVVPSRAEVDVTSDAVLGLASEPGAEGGVVASWDVAEVESVADASLAGEGWADEADEDVTAVAPRPMSVGRDPLDEMTPMPASETAPRPRASLAALALAALLGVAVGVSLGYVWWGRTAQVQTVTVAPEQPPARDDGASAVAAPSAAASSPAPSIPAAFPAPPAAPAGEAASTGNLLVRSTPAGATVFLDEERRGVTPLTLQRVALGTRRVRVQRDGFAPVEQQVRLTRARPSRSVEVRLARAAAPAAAPSSDATDAAATTGSLVVESRPAGATVLVNGRAAGTTPVTLASLEPGSYTVRLQLTGFRELTTAVRVTAGVRARTAVSLTSVEEP